MILIDIAVAVAQWVLRLAPERLQRSVEPDSVLGMAIGFVVVCLLGAVVLVVVVLVAG